CLQQVRGALQPRAQPLIQRGLQRPRDVVGRTRWRAFHQQGRKEVGDHRESQGVVQKVEQGGQAWHLDKIDLEGVLRTVLGRERRLVQVHALVSQGRNGGWEPAFCDRGLEKLSKGACAQRSQAHIEESHVV